MTFFHLRFSTEIVGSGCGVGSCLIFLVRGVSQLGCLCDGVLNLAVFWEDVVVVMLCRCVSDVVDAAAAHDDAKT